MSFQKCDWSVDGPQVGESELTDICLRFWKITECFNGANVETRRLFQGWLCLQGISTLRKWLWLIDGSIILWRARPTLSWSDINYDVVGAATTRRCQIVKKKKMLQMYSLKSTGEIQAKVGLCLIIVTPLFFPSVLFPCCVFSRHKRGALLHIPLQAFQLHHCTSPPELPGRYLSIRIYCVCVCVLQSQRGRGACVSSLTGPFFAAQGYFSCCSGGFCCCCCCVVRKLATCPTLTALRSLQFYAGRRASGRRRGVGARQFDSFALCFSWKHSLLAVSHAVS